MDPGSECCGSHSGRTRRGAREASADPMGSRQALQTPWAHGRPWRPHGLMAGPGGLCSQSAETPSQKVFSPFTYWFDATKSLLKQSKI